MCPSYKDVTYVKSISNFSEVKKYKQVNNINYGLFRSTSQ